MMGQRVREYRRGFWDGVGAVLALASGMTIVVLTTLSIAAGA